MFPVGGGMNPAYLKKMMSQMGVKSEELDAIKVTIELADKNLVIESPKVSIIEMHGNKTISVIGDIQEQERNAQNVSISKEDIEMVAEKSGKSKEKAKSALKETKGDIAEAILKLSE